VKAYASALRRDLEMGLAELQGRPIETIFFGGGTPSLFPGWALGQLLEWLRDNIEVAAGVEITLEANPGTLEHVRFDELLEAGVNRLSLGAQSFDDAQLRALGRVHSSKEIGLAFAEARNAGFQNINLDLMYGLPGQDPEGAVRDLHRALELHPEHLSWYQLTIEPNTAFHASPPVLPDQDAAWDIQLAGQEVLSRAGMRQYEISAWSAPDSRCAHNLNYWRFGDYIGIGAGAHEKLTLGGQVTRRARWRNPQRYQDEVARGNRFSEQHQPRPGELVFEFMLNALRLQEGFSLEQFELRSGLARATLERGLETARRRGLLASDDGERWHPTELGFRFLNDLQLLFLDDFGDSEPGSAPERGKTVPKSA
jgi:oxygen-independent coproporphyrinogen-3 oxidase